MLPEFAPTSLTDFSKNENRQAMLSALDKVQSLFGQNYPLVIGGEEIHTDDKITSINPAKTDEAVAYFSKGTKEHAEKALFFEGHQRARREGHHCG